MCVFYTCGTHYHYMVPTTTSKPTMGRCWRGAFTNRNGPDRTGMDRGGQEWASITGMDLKIHPKIHVLSVLDKKFWLSNVKYQISSMSRQFQCKKIFSNIFSVLPSYSSTLLLRLIYTSHLKCMNVCNN